jgi:hypothetical protein
MIKMRKVFPVVLAAIMTLTLGAGIALAKPEGIGDGIVDGQVLNGQHYNLNIIGMKNPKNANMDSNGGHVIFVDLNGKSKIELVESGTADAPGTAADEFAVLDKNATGGSPAVLALPNPDLDAYVIGWEDEETDTKSAYSIFVRPLGKPGGWAKITTCAEVINSDEMKDLLGKDQIAIIGAAAELGGTCSIENTGKLLREKGKSIFTNQTAALLTMVLQVDILDDAGIVVQTVYVRVPIFDDILEGEYWEYDNNGLKLLQVRIYRVQTDVSESDLPEWHTVPLP